MRRSAPAAFEIESSVRATMADLRASASDLPWLAHEESASSVASSTPLAGNRLVADNAEEFDARLRTTKFATFFDRQVLTYNTELLTTVQVFLASTSTASVLRKKSLYRGMGVTFAFSSGLIAILYACDWHKYATAEEVERLQGMSGSLHAVATFLCSFFITMCVGRWWALRNDCVGKYWGAVNDMTLLISTFFPRDSPEDALVRDRLLRWGVLAHELMYKQARGEASNLDDLVDSDLLRHNEKELLEKVPSKSQAICVWMASYFNHLAYGPKEEGGSRLPFPVTTLPQLLSLCCIARGAIGAVFAYCDTQVPFRYVHMLGVVVWAHNLLQGVTTSFVIVHCFKQQQWIGMCIEVGFLIFYPGLFLGLLHLGAGMLNPMRAAHDIDFPRGAYSYFMLVENRGFQQAGMKPPHGAPALWSPSAAANDLKEPLLESSPAA